MSQILEPTPTTTVGAPSHSPPDVRYAPGISLSRGLGWFSVGLGLAELFATDKVAQATGITDRDLLKTYGLRELACGIGALCSARPSGWMWARVVGDACDIGTLCSAMASKDHDRSVRATMAMAAVAGVTLLDVMNAVQLSTAASMEG